MQTGHKRFEKFLKLGFSSLLNSTRIIDKSKWLRQTNQLTKIWFTIAKLKFKGMECSFQMFTSYYYFFNRERPYMYYIFKGKKLAGKDSS